MAWLRVSNPLSSDYRKRKDGVVSGCIQISNAHQYYDCENLRGYARGRWRVVKVDNKQLSTPLLRTIGRCKRCWGKKRFRGPKPRAGRPEIGIEPMARAIELE